MSEQPNPEKILQTGLAFWASKTLLSAIEMGLFTELARGPEPFDALERTAGPAPALGARLPRHAGRARLPRARRRPLRQHARDRPVPRPEEAVLRRRHPRDGEPSALSVLGPPHRGAAHRRSRRTRSRRGGPGLFETLYADPARLQAVPRGDDRHQPRRQHDDRAAVPVEGLPHVRRRGHRAGRSGRADCAGQPAPAGHGLRPAGSGADLRGVRRGGRRRRPAVASCPGASSSTTSRRPTSC